GGLAGGSEGPPAGDLLQDDSAAPLAIALAEQPEGSLDPFNLIAGGFGQLVHRQRLRRHDQERLERPGERIDRVGRAQAERALHAGRKRRGPEPEEPVALTGQALREPLGRALDPPVLLEPARQLLRGLRRLEVLELGPAREQAARLQLEQRRYEHEELSARVEVELLALREPLDEREDDPRDVDLMERQLLPEDEGQQQVEWALERVEVELELADAH